MVDFFYLVISPAFLWVLSRQRFLTTANICGGSNSFPASMDPFIGLWPLADDVVTSEPVQLLLSGL